MTQIWRAQLAGPRRAPTCRSPPSTRYQYRLPGASPLIVAVCVCTVKGLSLAGEPHMSRCVVVRMLPATRSGWLETLSPARP